MTIVNKEPMSFGAKVKVFGKIYTVITCEFNPYAFVNTYTIGLRRE